MNAVTCLEDRSIRAEALRALTVFHTNPDERFGRLTRLAQRIFRVPVAKVTLVAHDTVYAVSCAGPPEAPVPRELSFCSHAIHSDDIMIVPDTLADDRFAGNPFVAGAPHVRFYAGCPLVVNGCRLGTLCLADQVPREMTHRGHHPDERPGNNGRA